MQTEERTPEDNILEILDMWKEKDYISKASIELMKTLVQLAIENAYTKGYASARETFSGV